MISSTQPETLAFKNPNNKAAVIKRLDAFIAEWRAWQQEVAEIKDHPYDRNTHSEVYADGENNLKRHQILRERTRVFLDNNISGHGFITGRDGSKIDRTDLRLRFRVKHCMDDLDQLRACLDEIGDVGSGEDDWITARGAVTFLGLGHHLSTLTICQRAYAGLIRARAERFVRNGQPADNVEIPWEFWWAKGERKLTQNWATGDFETWIDSQIHLEAFGVTFLRSDIERLRPTETLVQQGQKIMATAGQKIFIGHGHSLVWLELKSFLQDALHLTVDEFTRVSTAGFATSNRLKQMLDDAAFAFLILTAEDESTDGKLHARENVVHEAGLFQGRLGFEKAIILLEEKCEKFSNIDGLGYIPFPTGKIRAASEDIRSVLKREGLIGDDSPSSTKSPEPKVRFQYTHPRTPRDS